MQLTDKVLLPATVSYTDTGQQCSDDAVQPSDLCRPEPTAEAGSSDGDNTAADVDDGIKVDEKDSTVCSAAAAISDSVVHPATVTGCVEPNEPSSASSQAGPQPSDSAVAPSAMTFTVVNLQPDADVCDAVDLGSKTLLPTGVHIGDMLLKSTDTGAIVTDSAVAASSDELAGSRGKAPVSSAVLQHAYSSEVEQPAEWTR